MKMLVGVARIPLSKGYEAIVDAEDLPLLASWDWLSHFSYRADGSVRAVYAVRWEGAVRSRKAVFMHRVIMAAPTGLFVDHIDGNGLNNQRSNLRLANAAENARNRRMGVNNTSGIKGVSFDRASGKWAACIRVGGKSIGLGFYRDINAAAEAYARASQDMHGPFGSTAKGNRQIHGNAHEPEQGTLI